MFVDAGGGVGVGVARVSSFMSSGSGRYLQVNTKLKSPILTVMLTNTVYCCFTPICLETNVTLAGYRCLLSAWLTLLSPFSVSSSVSSFRWSGPSTTAKGQQSRRTARQRSET